MKRVFCLHNNDGSDDSAVKAGLMLQGQRKIDINFDNICVNDNVSNCEQGDTSVRCSVRDYIDQLYIECAFLGNNSEGYSIIILYSTTVPPNTKSLHNQVINE